ncbi:MAG TPA: hypothetical protein VGP94_04470 [Tepidisphaeraceae bacterium]|nr:hypothetical protein [Tepidisphaeraceae bacterium]
MTIARFSRLLSMLCFATLLLMFAGCWGSKFTLVNPDQAKIDHAYLGNWSVVNSKGESSSLIIRNIDDKLFYVETKEGAKQYPEGITRYVGFLAPVKAATFAHLRHLQDDGHVQEDWLLMRLELNGDKLTIRQLKDDYMKEKNITSSEQLRKVIEQSIDDGSMYDKEEVLTATRLTTN